MSRFLLAGDDLSGFGGMLRRASSLQSLSFLSGNFNLFFSHLFQVRVIAVLWERTAYGGDHGVSSRTFVPFSLIIAARDPLQNVFRWKHGRNAFHLASELSSAGSKCGPLLT